MPHRSRKQKQKFSCGHRGLGQYCHCCAARRAKKSQQKRPKSSLHSQCLPDPIDLSHLPQSIATKASKILAALAQGKGYWQLGGRRLKAVPGVIRIPVTHRYRLLCWEEQGRIVPWRVLSHEAYNPLVRNQRRLSHLRVSRGSGEG